MWFRRRKRIENVHTDSGRIDAWSAEERNGCIRRKNTVPMAKRRDDVWSVEIPNRQYFYAGTDVKGKDSWTVEASDMQK